MLAKNGKDSIIHSYMSVIDQAELWQQFNLAENNPDPGGGILYAIRYAAEDLKAHQAKVIESLMVDGASIQEAGIGLGVHLGGLSHEQRERALLILEELSVVNDALEYYDAGVNADSIEALAGQLISAYYAGLTPAKKVDAFDLVSDGIPQITREIQHAHAQNGVLSAEDLSKVMELQEFASRQANILGGHNIVIIS